MGVGWIMAMTTDRPGSVVRVPGVRKVDVFREGDGGIVVLTLDGGVLPFVTDIGCVRYDRYEDAETAFRMIGEDLEAGRDPPELIAMVKAVPAPFPWRFALFVVAIIMMAVVMSGL
jgi:hypothetical protein